MALEAGHSSRAIEAYSGALALRPDSMVAFVKRGETYQRQGDLEAAVRDLSRAATLDPVAPRPHERLGDVARVRDDHDQAIVHYARQVQLDDGNLRGLYKLALAYHHAGAPQTSLTLLRRATDLDERFSEAHYLRGLCLSELARVDEAREALQRAIELAPGFLEARDALVTLHRRRGDRRAALEQLDALAALDRDRPTRHVARGLAYAEAGQGDLALLALRQAAGEHPDEPAVHEALARVSLDLADRSDDDVTIDQARDALDAVPVGQRTSTWLTLRARVLRWQGRDDEARRLLRLAIDRYPVDPVAFSHLARLEDAADNPGEARRLRRRYRALVAPRSSSRSVTTTQPAV